MRNEIRMGLFFKSQQFEIFCYADLILKGECFYTFLALVSSLWQILKGVLQRVKSKAV